MRSLDPSDDRVFFARHADTRYVREEMYTRVQNLVRLCPWSLLMILDMGPRKFHPVDKMAAILLTPLPEKSIFVISP